MQPKNQRIGFFGIVIFGHINGILIVATGNRTISMRVIMKLAGGIFSFLSESRNSKQQQ